MNYFSQRIQIRFFFLGGGGGGGIDGWTVEQAKPNLPLHLLRGWGHNNALMYKFGS